MTARLAAAAAVVAGLALVPQVAGTYPVKLVQEILIWAIFAMSLDLIMGYAGMVSFGHSAFFGVGGYVAALGLMAWPGLTTALLLPAAAAALAALVIGFFSIRVSGVYFIMLTLAFSQMFYAVTFQAAWLGAEDGIFGVPRPRPFGVTLSDTGGFHAYVLVL
ncbi:MAG TPA: branched-chain amino acid ABC transporter permease, partial [Methylomirabilota bacterium]|nr:branched-chain amino acid ABC transporter permease [Methylomirabilota bacterium]